MKDKKKLIKIIVALVLVVAIIVGAVIFAKKEAEDNMFKAVIMDVTTSTVTQTLSTQGTVESLNRGEFEIYDGVVVKEVLVKLGDKVEKGQLLATFEPSSLNGIIAKKQADYDSARINYQNCINSANEASAKLPVIEAQIAELEKEIVTLTAAAEKAKEEAAAKPESQPDNVPDWVKNIDYDRLVKLLGNSYTSDELYGFFASLANRGADRATVTDIINSLSMGSSFDISSMLGSSSVEAQLMSAQMSLMTLKAQKTMLETQAQNLLESTYKSLMDTAKLSLDATKLSVEKLAKGWYAEGDGVVSEINIRAGESYTAVQNTTPGMDMTSVMGMLSGGGNIDVNSLISSFASSGSAKSIGMAVEYYDSFIASFSLGKYDILDVKVGQKAKITSLGHELEGEVIYISPIATNNSGFDISSMIGSMGGTGATGSNSIPARVLIKNPDESIIIGIDVDIDIELEVVENAVTVPIEAVETDNTGTYIYKLNDDNETVTRVEVELGLATDTHYEVVSGCSAGDKIVQNPATALKEIAAEGEKVAVTYASDAAV